MVCYSYLIWWDQARNDQRKCVLTVLRNGLCIFVVFSILVWFVANFNKHVDKSELNCEGQRVLVCQVERGCVWVWKGEISASAQTLSVGHLLAPEAIPTCLQGGRQVNEKLLILPLYPRRWREVTLILPNFVFPFLLMPRSFDSHSGSLGMRTTERGGGVSMWLVMPSATFSGSIKGRQ